MTAPTLPTVFHVAAWGLSFVVLALAARQLPWFKLRGDSEAQHVLFAAVLAVCVLRFAVFDRIPGLHLHFLGAGIVCLMFGTAFALWVMALASLAAALSPAGVWLGVGPDYLACGLIPVLFLHAVRTQVERRLPGNPFVYVFLIAFFGAGLAVLLGQLFKAAVTAGLVEGAARDAAMGYVISAPLMVFGEAFLTGGALALMVAYRPQWVASFEDARWLKSGD
jgi:uncharacterized membrane protein